MIEEQEYNIALDSPLDANMNDMFVPAAEPRFIYNRQKLLGGLLQTSVRFEDDGYFAGWWRHQFILVSTGLNVIQPMLSPSLEEEEKNLVIYDKTTDKGVPYFILQERSAGLKFKHNPNEWYELFTGSLFGSQTLRSDDYKYALWTSTDATNSEFALEFDLYQGKVDAFNPVTGFNPFNHYAVCALENNALHVIVDRPYSIGEDWFDVKMNNDVYVNGILLNVSAVDNYGDFVTTYGATTMKPQGEFRVLSDGKGGDKTVYTSEGSEFSRVSNSEFKNNTVADLKYNLSYTDMWKSVQFTGVEVGTDLVGDTTIDHPVNRQTANVLSLSSIGNSITIEHGVPYWYTIKIPQFTMGCLVRDSNYWQVMFYSTGGYSESSGTINMQNRAIYANVRVEVRVSKLSIDGISIAGASGAWMNLTNLTSGSVIDMYNATDTVGLYFYRYGCVRNDCKIGLSLRVSLYSTISPIQSGYVAYQVDYVLKRPKWLNVLDRTDISMPYQLVDFADFVDSCKVYRDFYEMNPSAVNSTINGKYYEILNADSLDFLKDKTLYNQSFSLGYQVNANYYISTSSSKTLTLPICFRAVAQYQVVQTTVTRDTKKDPTRAFAINASFNIGNMGFLINTESASTINLHQAPIVEASLKRVVQSSKQDEYDLIVALEPSNFSTSTPKYLYYAIAQPTALTNDNDSTQVSSFSPNWCTGTSSIASANNQYIIAYKPSEQMNIFVKIHFKVTSCNFLDWSESNFTSKEVNFFLSKYNYNLFDKVKTTAFATMTNSSQIAYSNVDSYQVYFFLDVNMDIINDLPYDDEFRIGYEEGKSFYELSHEYPSQTYRMDFMKMYSFVAVFNYKPSTETWSYVRTDIGEYYQGDPHSLEYGIDFAIEPYSDSIVTSAKDSNEKYVTIKVKSNSIFNVNFDPAYFVRANGFLLANNNEAACRVIALNGNKLTVSLGLDTVEIDTSAMKFPNSAKIAYLDTEQLVLEPNVYRFYIARRDAFEGWFIPAGIFWRLGDGINSGPRYINHTETDTHYVIEFKLPADDFNRFAYIDKEAKLNLLYETKDIRDNSSAKFVYQNTLDKTFMFVKQFWSDTIYTENYWWIDADHVLELQRDDIVVWEKDVIQLEGVTVNAVHDWNGDKWHVMQETYQETYLVIEDGQQVEKTRTVTKDKKAPRTNFIGSDDIYYNVTSAKNPIYGGPVFFKLRAAYDAELGTDAITVMQLWDILNETFNLMTPDKFISTKIPVRIRPFGQGLSNDSICSYSNITAHAVVTSSKISSTVIDNILMIGVAFTRGMSQWTIVMPYGEPFFVVTGYGHVGIDGTLTGNQLPSNYCGPLGFRGAAKNIEDLESLKGSEFYNQSTAVPTLPSNACYSNGSEFWFITKQLDSFISHLTWEKETMQHKPIEIVLTSNVERIYESTSFSGQGLFDGWQDPISFMTLFGSTLNISEGFKIVASILLPVLFYLDFKYIMMCHINHSFGQYAYVWYNSQRNYEQKGKTDQEIKFLEDKYTVSLDQSEDNFSLWIQVILKAVSDIDNVAVDYVVNKGQSQVNSNDSIGRRLGQFAIETINDTIVDLIDSKGMNIALKSTLQQFYTPEMFYSVSDDQQCFAGPGFVNHNFMSQCIAQSATDMQIVGKRVGYWVTLKTLSEIVLSLKTEILAAVRDLLQSLAVATGPATTGATVFGTGVNVPVGIAIATVCNIAAGVMDALILVNREGLKLISGLADAVGSSQGQGYSAGTLKKYALDIEPTHAYGNKPMSFFYPAYGVLKNNTYTNEWVGAAGEAKEQNISFSGNKKQISVKDSRQWSNGFSNSGFLDNNGNGMAFKGPLKTVSVKCKGMSSQKEAPARTAVVEGVKTFLSSTPFRNEQIGVSPPAFSQPPIHDYEIDQEWKLGFTAGAGEILWVTCDDTKLIDGPPSNIVITKDFCGVASSYIALEIKNEFDARYLRPWAVTPQAIALNINKMNCVQEQKVYHAFDGQGNRILKWTGGMGMDKATEFLQYQYQVNDHFKRSNILPPSRFMGYFTGPPYHAMTSLSPGEPVANVAVSFNKQQGLEDNIPGELKELTRYSIPVHSKVLSTLPAMVRTLAPYKLNVIEGVTSLTTDIRNTQTRYKAPFSIDFNIYNEAYRATDEYLCKITTEAGIVAVNDICVTAGLTFIGATTKEAFFHSPATRMYYSFSNGKEIVKQGIMNRFLDLKDARWDYVNQEVMFKAFDREGEIVARLDGDVLGEVFPPNKTIKSSQSDYALLSMAGGLVFQGPKRFSVNRFVILDYMLDDIKYYSRRKYTPVFPLESGKKNWKRVSRDYYDQDRDYGWEYVDFDTVKMTTDIFAPSVPAGGLIDHDSVWWSIHGWTHNPYGLVTSMLGVDDVADCKFEWLFTFTWTSQMDKFYESNEYVVVNVMAETVTQGGTLKSEPTHIFLTKECFTRSGNAGYYTFKFQSNNGQGNREKLYIWGDGIIAIQDLKLRCKEVTRNRNQPLYMQADIQNLVEA